MNKAIRTALREGSLRVQTNRRKLFGFGGVVGSVSVVFHVSVVVFVVFYVAVPGCFLNILTEESESRPLD